MVHHPLLLAHWISLWYTTITYWPTCYPYDTQLSFTCPLEIFMAHYPLQPTGNLYGTLPSPISPLAIPMIHVYLLLAQWISLWYTTFSYWPTGYPYVTLPSSTGLLDSSRVHYFSYWPSGYPYVTLLSSIGTLEFSMVHHPLLLAYRLSLWYTILSYWPTGYFYGTLSFPIGQLAIPMLHCYFLLAHWLSLWYTILSY